MLNWINSNKFFIDEFMYILCGLISILTAFRGLKNKEARIGTFLFWFLVGIIFACGGFLVKYLPESGGAIVGALLVICGILTLTNQVKIGEFNPPTDEERRKNADKVGWKIFIPALVMAGLGFFMSQVRSFNIVIGTDAKGKNIIFGFTTAQVLGVSSLIALILVVLITKAKLKDTKEDTTRLLMHVGASSLLPQLLGALGIVFEAAGVGNIIGELAGGVVGGGGRVAGVVAYCLGMVIFTMIMGNAFAAFTVITIGIGIPFVIAQGGNPAVVGALGMTCGYCGTLLTPMAANFNIVPAAILENKDKYAIIKKQAPVAFAMILIHIILMLVMAF
ncbi:MAG: DUF979 domain-containing protein [Parvimonas sp.]|jgi:hypothetical protein|nr:DUF979 domain-containing protein [Parvimonas sp.]MBF1053516.1 DUF979 domain-containing protein [Parvimonas sp.]